MKILVTGGAGFIGSAVVRLAIARGHEIINLDALTMLPRWKVLRALKIIKIINLYS